MRNKEIKLDKKNLTEQAKIKFGAFLPTLKLRQAGVCAFVALGLFVGVLGFGGSARAVGIQPDDFSLKNRFDFCDMSLFTYATMDSISLSLKVSDTTSSDGHYISVKFRKHGDSAWRDAHSLDFSEYDMTRYPNEKWLYGSIVLLEKNEIYNLNISCFDENDTLVQSDVIINVQTRPEPTYSTNNTIYVSSVSGSNSNDGTIEYPFETIQYAVDLASPGTKVKILAGNYFENVVISQSGTSEYPIIIEGSENANLMGYVNYSDLSWTLDTDDLYYTNFSYLPFSLDAGSENDVVNRDLIYRYYDIGGGANCQGNADFDLNDLRNRTGEIPNDSVNWCIHNAVYGGWFYDNGTQRMYLRMPDNSDPNNTSVRVIDEDIGIDVRGDFIIIKDLTIKYFQTGIMAQNQRFNIIENNTIQRCGDSVQLQLLNSISGENISGLYSWSDLGTAGTETKHYAGALNEGNIIQGNNIWEEGIREWGYGRTKSRIYERSGIGGGQGSGLIVRDNTVNGYFKGVGLNWDVDQTNRDLNRDFDVYNNVILNSGSDGLEPEGNLINVRFWDNQISGFMQGISIAPVRYGPLYAFRNIFHDYSLSGIKFSSNSAGKAYLYNNLFSNNQDGVVGWRASGYYENIVLKNNIFLVKNSFLIMDDLTAGDNDMFMDYNLYYTPYVHAGWPAGSIMQVRRHWSSNLEDLATWSYGQYGVAFEAHGVFSNLTFEEEWPVNNIPNDNTFRPISGSENIDNGTIIPNFCDIYSGDAPDIGVYEYYSGVDLTPPSRSNPQPTGILISGTTQTTISLTTNETAACKYSETAGTAYDDMTNSLFADEAGTNHSTNITNLEDGNPYTYYVRCADTATPPNQNPDDFNISFSIATSTTYTISDFITLVSDWLTSGVGLESDVNGDGVVNTRDLGIMMSNWSE